MRIYFVFHCLYALYHSYETTLIGAHTHTHRKVCVDSNYIDCGTCTLHLICTFYAKHNRLAQLFSYYARGEFTSQYIVLASSSSSQWFTTTKTTLKTFLGFIIFYFKCPLSARSLFQGIPSFGYRQLALWCVRWTHSWKICNYLSLSFETIN